MAGRGPAPKDPDKRVRRNKDPEPTSTVGSRPRLRGPALPSGVLPDNEKWHKVTIAWWKTWRESPQAELFLATDWDFLLDTALMHHVMWSKGRWEFAAEIRLRAAKFGATADDRQRLKMKVETPPAKLTTAVTPSNVTSITARRKRLTA